MDSWGEKELNLYLERSLSSPLVIDFETTGLNVKEDVPVGVGIADALFPEGVYFNLKNATHTLQMKLASRLIDRKLIAHNVTFDGGILARWIGDEACTHWPWYACTYGLYRQLSNEGFAGQEWGLKQAQMDLLLWDDKGDVELDKWLVKHGHVKGRDKRADKGKMHLAPTSILGYYGGLDCQSTWALWKLFEDSLKDDPDQKTYHHGPYMNLIRLITEEYFRGMRVDSKQLLAYRETLIADIEELKNEFLYNSPAKDAIREYNAEVVQKMMEGLPDKYTKTGQLSKNWVKRMEKVKAARGVNHFNLRSKAKQLNWLFYERLFPKWEEVTEIDWRGKEKHWIDIDIGKDLPLRAKRGKLKKDGTFSIQLDKNVLPFLGEAGKILLQYNTLDTELGYLNSMLETLVDDVHYTQMRPSGTVTDRCAGTGGVNIQQLTKRKGYLECIKPREGFRMVQMDVDSLEPTVIAELSKDAGYRSVYGMGRKDCVYLFVGSKIPQFRDKIRKYYDPENPTPEGIDAAKHYCKHERDICKVFHLSASYGAGAKKIYSELILKGVDITLKEVYNLRQMYWKVFAQVVNYQDSLTEEWTENGGWFRDGLGCRVAVDEDCKKDMLNRCIQNTGHKILVKYLDYMNRLRYERDMGDKMFPLVCDWHDETVWEVKAGYEDKAIQIMNDVWTLLNNELGGDLPLSGTPEIVESFADFKVE